MDAPSPATLEPNELVKVADQLSKESRSENTRKRYAENLERFFLWIETHLGETELSDKNLSHYLAWLYASGKSPSTAAVAVAACRAEARIRELPDPLGKRSKLVMGGFRRAGRSRGTGQAAPLLWAEVDQIIKRLEKKGAPRDLRNAALIKLMSDGLLRVSEAVAITLEDVEVSPDGSGLLHIRAAKTDQTGEGKIVYISKRGIGIFQKWIHAAGISAGPVFYNIRKNGKLGRPLRVGGVGEIISRCAREAGIRKPGIRGHSPRVGSAQSLVERGADVAELIAAGRWKSPATAARYVMGQEARRGPVRRLLDP